MYVRECLFWQAQRPWRQLAWTCSFAHQIIVEKVRGGVHLVPRVIGWGRSSHAWTNFENGCKILHAMGADFFENYHFQKWKTIMHGYKMLHGAMLTKIEILKNWKQLMHGKYFYSGTFLCMLGPRLFEPD